MWLVGLESCGWLSRLECDYVLLRVAVGEVFGQRKTIMHPWILAFSTLSAILDTSTPTADSTASKPPDKQVARCIVQLPPYPLPPYHAPNEAVN